MYVNEDAPLSGSGDDESRIKTPVGLATTLPPLLNPTTPLRRPASGISAGEHKLSSERKLASIDVI